MRKIIGLVALLLIVSCKNEAVDYVTLKGKVNSPLIKTITVQGQNYSKDIAVNDNGVFSDTLKINEGGIHAISNGNDRITMFLQNGYDLNLEFKGELLGDGILYTGNGAETNNYMEQKRMFFESDLANPKTYFTLDKDAFEAKIAETKNVLQGYKNEAKNLDSLISQMDARNDEMFFEYVESNYEKAHADMVRFAKGTVSPTFKNYENYAGGETSLSDLKGKYVYIDVWATWCGPCKVEIPFLKKLEKEFHGKNIEFVSLSVDKQTAYEDWKEMIKEKEMGGIQLIADNNFESEFVLSYGINSIPRFILLDPNGNIVDADADRPSNPKLKELFLELGI